MKGNVKGSMQTLGVNPQLLFANSIEKLKETANNPTAMGCIVDHASIRNVAYSRITTALDTSLVGNRKCGWN
jgi:hypothetical protein